MSESIFEYDEDVEGLDAGEQNMLGNLLDETNGGSVDENNFNNGEFSDSEPAEDNERAQHPDGNENDIDDEDEREEGEYSNESTPDSSYSAASDYEGTDQSCYTPISGIGGSSSYRKHIVRFIKDVVRTASETYESEELGRLLGLLTSRAGMGKRKCINLISLASGRLLESSMLSAFYESGGERFSAQQIVEMAYKCAGGATADKKAIMVTMVDLVESKMLSPDDDESVKELVVVGEYEWTWEERRNYCILLCEACNKKKQAAMILMAFCAGLSSEKEIELVQTLVDQEFFLDLSGRQDDMWLFFPHLEGKVRLPRREGGGYDANDGFIVDEDTESDQSEPLNGAVSTKGEIDTESDEEVVKRKSYSSDRNNQGFEVKDGLEGKDLGSKEDEWEVRGENEESSKNGNCKKRVLNDQSESEEVESEGRPELKQRRLNRQPKSDDEESLQCLDEENIDY
mmetsp:Transcript_10525/g.15789  ORF Transcript_10525/g.15789 Transcript_10525/m.15789 type:complete len:457 (+) Transcript_10525:56-1426(+)